MNLNLLSVLQVISLLAPIVRGAVETAETVLGPGKGTTKLAEATARVESALPKVEALAANIDAARAAVKPLIEATVAAANASGAFKRSKPARRRKKSK